MAIQKIYRTEEDQIIAGVAGGLGEYFQIDPTIFRLIFVFLLLAEGSGLLLYAILWIVLPAKSDLEKSGEEVIKSNTKEMGEKAKKATAQVQEKIKRFEDKSKPGFFERQKWLGIILVGLGIVFLLQNFVHIDLSLYWPLVLIVVGLAIFTRSA